MQTWKKQLTANAEYDLAKRVLVAVYKVRDTIEHCRSFDSLDKYANETEKQLDILIAKIDDASASLAVELLEAEAIWGGEKRYLDGVAGLNLQIIRLKMEYSEYQSAKVKPNDDEYPYSILFHIGFPEPGYKDEFSRLLDNDVISIEDVLRPKLTLKQAKKKEGYWWERFKKWLQF